MEDTREQVQVIVNATIIYASTRKSDRKRALEMLVSALEEVDSIAFDIRDVRITK